MGVRGLRGAMSQNAEPKRSALRSQLMRRDFNVFLQPGFWVALLLLAALYAACVAVIAMNSTYPVPSVGG
jgi:hypothetical protein